MLVGSVAEFLSCAERFPAKSIAIAKSNGGKWLYPLRRTLFNVYPTCFHFHVPPIFLVLTPNCTRSYERGIARLNVGSETYALTERFTTHCPICRLMATAVNGSLLSHSCRLSFGVFSLF